MARSFKKFILAISLEFVEVLSVEAVEVFSVEVVVKLSSNYFEANESK